MEGEQKPASKFSLKGFFISRKGKSGVVSSASQQGSDDGSNPDSRTASTLDLSDAVKEIPAASAAASAANNSSSHSSSASDLLGAAATGASGVSEDGSLVLKHGEGNQQKKAEGGASPQGFLGSLRAKWRATKREQEKQAEGKLAEDQLKRNELNTLRAQLQLLLEHCLLHTPHIDSEFDSLATAYQKLFSDRFDGIFSTSKIKDEVVNEQGDFPKQLACYVTERAKAIDAYQKFNLKDQELTKLLVDNPSNKSLPPVFKAFNAQAKILQDFIDANKIDEALKQKIMLIKKTKAEEEAFIKLTAQLKTLCNTCLLSDIVAVKKFIFSTKAEVDEFNYSHYKSLLANYQKQYKALVTDTETIKADQSFYDLSKNYLTKREEARSLHVHFEDIVTRLNGYFANQSFDSKEVKADFVALNQTYTDLQAKGVHAETLEVLKEKIDKLQEAADKANCPALKNRLEAASRRCLLAEAPGLEEDITAYRRIRGKFAVLDDLLFYADSRDKARATFQAMRDFKQQRLVSKSTPYPSLQEFEEIAAQGDWLLSLERLTSSQQAVRSVYDEIWAARNALAHKPTEKDQAAEKVCALFHNWLKHNPKPCLLSNLDDSNYKICLHLESDATFPSLVRYKYQKLHLDIVDCFTRLNEFKAYNEVKQQAIRTYRTFISNGQELSQAFSNKLVNAETIEHKFKTFEADYAVLSGLIQQGKITTLGEQITTFYSQVSEAHRVYIESRAKLLATPAQPVVVSHRKKGSSKSPRVVATPLPSDVSAAATALATASTATVVENSVVSNPQLASSALVSEAASAEESVDPVLPIASPTALAVANINEEAESIATAMTEEILTQALAALPQPAPARENTEEVIEEVVINGSGEQVQPPVTSLAIVSQQQSFILTVVSPEALVAFLRKRSELLKRVLQYLFPSIPFSPTSPRGMPVEVDRVGAPFSAEQLQELISQYSQTRIQTTQGSVVTIHIVPKARQPLLMLEDTLPTSQPHLSADVFMREDEEYPVDLSLLFADPSVTEGNSAVSIKVRDEEEKEQVSVESDERDERTHRDASNAQAGNPPNNYLIKVNFLKGLLFDPKEETVVYNEPTVFYRTMMTLRAYPILLIFIIPAVVLSVIASFCYILASPWLHKPESPKQLEALAKEGEAKKEGQKPSAKFHPSSRTTLRL